MRSLFGSVNSNVARAGNYNGLALEGIVLHALEHFFGVVAKSVAGSLGACKRTAVGKTLTGENAGKLVAESLILTEHIADFSGTRAYIARRNIGVRADVL